jgi:maleate isomerase
VTRLGLVVPYEAEVARRIERTYAAAGIEVVASAHLGISDNAAFADVGADEIRRLVAPVAAEQPHAVAIVCTNVFGAPLVAELERRHGVPVFDSVSATLWQALHLVGADVTVTGCGTLLEAGSLRLRLQEALEDLLAVTGADRTTLRLDVPAKGFGCNLTAAEAMRPGVRSIRRDASLPQRRLNTVVWLEEQRRPLVQPHFRAEPSPPQALIEVYGVRAQMLGPIVRGDDMVGWLSVHSLAEREWRDTDLVALAEATGRVHAALDHL